MKNNIIDRIKRKLMFLNLSSFSFIIVSIMSVTFAWFAYLNTVNSSMEIGIKSWNIEITRDDSIVSNVVEIDVDSFYPGMEDYTKTMFIANKGDINARLNYKIKELRIFDSKYTELTTTQDINDIYPWVISMYSEYNKIKPNKSIYFNVSISWPLDSYDDELDTYYGKMAYNFKKEEESKKKKDSSYEIRSCISMTLELNVEQDLSPESMFDVSLNNPQYMNTSNTLCDKNSAGAIQINPLKINEDNTALFYKNLDTLTNAGSYTYSTSLMKTNDVVGYLSSDIFDTKIYINEKSSKNIGYITDENSLDRVIDIVKNNNTYIYATPNYFPYFYSGNKCFWTDKQYSPGKHFAFKKEGEIIKLYGENDSASCYYTNTINLILN